MTLIEAMTKAKMDEDRLADLAGLTPRAIKSYFYGERRPSKLNQGRIERVLKSEIDWGYMYERTQAKTHRQRACSL